MANKISVLVDVTVDKGLSALKKLRTSVQEADGVSGKLKAGFGSMAESVKANALAMAATAGAALIAFGIKAVGAFTDTATAAQDAGKSIGVSTEDASRWIAVGDDFGLTAEQVAQGLGKVATTIDAAKWDKYGIATRDASGEARDANEILLDTFDTLAKETNLTERSRLAKELLGKGYATLSPLIGKTRAELEKYLGSVEDGQVITAEEAAKARDMALAQDALRDAFGEITLAVGGLVSKFSPLIENFASAITKAEELTGKLGVVGEVLDAEASFLMGDFSGAVDGATGKHVNFKLSADELEKSLRKQGFSQEEIVNLLKRQKEATEAAKGKTDDLTGSTDDLTDEQKGANRAVDIGIGHLRDLERAADRSGSQVEELADSVARLRGELDQEQAALDFANAIDEFGQAMDNAEGDTSAQAQALIDVKGKMLDYLAALQGVPVSKQTEIVALIDQGELQAAEKALNDLARTRTATVLAGVGQFSGSSGSTPKKSPGGGKTPDGESSFVGGNTITLNAYGVNDPVALRDMLNKEIRRSGGTPI